MGRSWLIALLCVLAGSVQAADPASTVPVSRRVEALPEIGTDRLAGLGEVHFAGVALSDDDAPIVVTVAEGESPIVLALMSLSTVEWRFTGAVDRLRAVVVVRPHTVGRSLLTGLPDSVPAFRPSLELRHNEWRQNCPATAPRSPGGQCLDPAFRIDGESIGGAALTMTGKRDGFSSLSVRWRSRALAVPGRPDVARSVGEARALLGEPALSVLRDRLGGLGNPPVLSVAHGVGRELHVVDAAPCSIGLDCPSHQAVTVPPTGQPLVLALRASRDVNWRVEVEYGARLAGILLLGETAPLSLQAPAEVPVAVLLDALSEGTHPILHLLEPSQRERDLRGWERLERYPATGHPITLR
jgi:hypothetical protein